MYLYLDEEGEVLVRSAFSKAGIDNTTAPVKKRSDGAVYCYKRYE